MRRYATAVGLAAAVLACGLYIYVDRDSATSDELALRRENLFPVFHRDRVDRIEVERADGRYELHRQGGDWVVAAGGHGRGADALEVERVLSEIEGAQPTRRAGSLDGPTRERFGLDHPRARVTVREGTAEVARFAVGGAVSGEAAAYVESGGRGFVLPKSFADAFDRPGADLRDKNVAELDPSRIDRMELTGAAADGGHRVLERRGPVWRVTAPDLGRAARGAVEAVTSELHALHATRVLADDVTDAASARYGLAAPMLRLVVTRGAPSPVTLLALRIGGPCPGHDGEFAATREGTGTVVCIGRAFVDALRVPPEGFRDDHLLAARTDEVDRVRIHPAAGPDLVLRREGGRWHLAGDTAPVDAEAVESWLNTLHDLQAAQRLPGNVRAAHGLAPPSGSVEISRTGVEGSERIDLGATDAAGLYVARDDEPLVLVLPPSAAETLRVEAIRFRPKHLIHDVEGDLQALLIEAGPLREDITRVDGALRLTRPVDAAADPGLVHDLARQLEDLDVDRWVSEAVRPEYGLAAPRARLVARFEGAGAREHTGDGEGNESDAGADASVPRVRSYTLAFGAQAPGGGLYATLEGTRGVFVLPRGLYDALAAPHLDRGALRVPPDGLTRLAITRAGATPARVVLVRDGARWRTEAGTPADAARVNALLDRLGSVMAPRMFGYGPAPAGQRLGALVVEASYARDGGASAMRVTAGGEFGSGEAAGVYARRDGLDATLSLPADVAEALTSFEP